MFVATFLAAFFDIIIFSSSSGTKGSTVLLELYWSHDWIQALAHLRKQDTDDIFEKWTDEQRLSCQAVASDLEIYEP